MGTTLARLDLGITCTGIARGWELAWAFQVEQMLMLGDGQGPRRLSELSFDLTAAEVERWNSYGKLVNIFGLPRVDIYSSSFVG